MNPEFKKINLDEKIIHPRKRRKTSKFWKIFYPLLAVGLVLFIVWAFFFPSNSVFHSVIRSVSGSQIKQTNDRVNILLLGIGGGTHDGPDLTDSIIVASYNLKTKEVVMFSIPRDLWLPSIKEKINAAYTIGLSKDQGLPYTESAIGDVMGIPIHYGVVLDFRGFSRAIDLVGGVDIDVPDTFDDYEYPIEGKENDLCGWKEEEINVTDEQSKQLNIPKGQAKVFIDPNGKIATDSGSLDFSCRFEHIHFNKGMMHMDGTLALKFVRSRHALGAEGSDFARSRRQQLVIQAFRGKVFSLQTIANPQKDIGLLGTLGSSLTTDIPKDQYLEFYSLAKNVKTTKSFVLGDLDNGQSLFINPPPDNYGGAWVLTPPNDDFTVVKQFVQNALNPPPPSPSPSSSGKPKAGNGTKTP